MLDVTTAGVLLRINRLSRHWPVDHARRALSERLGRRRSVLISFFICLFITRM